MGQLEELYHFGQSTWLNYLRRAFIESGELRQAVNEGIAGITSTPLIFEKAITSSADYDQAIRDLVAEGKPVKTIYEALVVDDIQRTADVLHPVFEMSSGLEGYVSLELDPSLAHDAIGTVAEARHILHEVNRPNAMIEIPATEAGIAAIEALIHDGVNVNATHIFSLETYKKVAEAYLRGIEMYIHSHSVWRQNPASVASFSLSPLDRAVDSLLDQRNRPDLKKQTAIAMAKVAYKLFQQVFSGASWQRLARRGAAVQRLKWTRTTPFDYDYSVNHYVEELIGTDTVVTMSPATLSAYRNQGTASTRLQQDYEASKAHLAELEGLGIDLELVGQGLQERSLAAFDSYFQSLIRSVISKRDQLDFDWKRYESELGSYETEVDRALIKFCEERTMCRIWAGDHTVWKPDPEEITNRMGWMHSIEIMRENVGRLNDFTRSLRANEGASGPITNAVVLGMGGSSLAAQLFGTVFARSSFQSSDQSGYPEVTLLDTTVPDVVSAMASDLDLAHTIFIVSSKSGRTVETMSAFNYFYNLVSANVGPDNAGQHFVAITDPGTALTKIADNLNFRELFLNDPNIGGRYAALSYFGLVSAALAGVDLDQLLDRAFSMAVNAHSCNCPMKGDNIAAQFGTALGTLANAGCDKLTIFTSPSISNFGDWAEQLIAESTGKDGKGILPVVGEPIADPGHYASDRFFAYVRLEGDDKYDQAVTVLIQAKFPVVVFNLKDVYDLGGMFFIWEMATAVACTFLGINPFDQPNVEEAKNLARSLVGQYRESDALPDIDAEPSSAEALSEFLKQLQPGDYIAVQAFLPYSPKIDQLIQGFRRSLRDKYNVSTAVGYGPRYLHSTGQLHKGDGANGLFIQFTADPRVDIPIPTNPGSPESDITCGLLKQAQALGDASALRKKRRRIIQFHLGSDVISGLESLQEVS